MLCAPVTLGMFASEGFALVLLIFLAMRYRDNLRTMHIRSPNQVWSILFAVFLGSATIAISLLWSMAYLKCLDTSNTLVEVLGPGRAAYECRPWQFLSRANKYAVFMIYYNSCAIATIAFQLLVLERYRKISHLFPKVVEQYGLRIYLSIYGVASALGWTLGIAELFISPSTIISRASIINTLSSVGYCIWIASTGITDAILGWVIVTQIRRGRREMSMGDTSHSYMIGRLGTLQKLFALIVFFDCGIVTLTSLKKTESHIIHGHIFAWEIAGIEVSATILHATMTLCFMQMLAGVLSSSQPQFDFVVRNKGLQTGTATQGEWSERPKRPALACIQKPSQAKLGSTEKVIKEHELDCSALDVLQYQDTESSNGRRGTVVTFNSALSLPGSSLKSPVMLLSENEMEEDALLRLPNSPSLQAFANYDMRQAGAYS
ncbi:hypothetical protein BCR37DRAFT_387555 [Protomyces lactucae-debilis]|uniref:Uncharacterized protein n=1 Tax=Protomyces lactucae-debilis TaxID=2754530 RepID=A0A1Y2FDT7_PROLT|nr:uncharacterized protein BCR37DRAFT_387555 [Protomyces lactucae-debilis]ORY82088.1 hypothetical protein BCR37DRAFT_387555 [Protomyces lactucae-debilis]